MQTLARNPKLALICACCIVGATAAGQAHAVFTFTVDSTLDQLDDDPGDGVCHTAANTCTLRAAVMEANRVSAPSATIVLPAGVYGLTRSATGSNDELNGDLDFTNPAVGNPVITLQGAGAEATIIDANQIDRVLEVQSSRTTIINNVTLRNGLTSGDGGGVLVRGSLQLTACIVLANRSDSLVGGGGAYVDGFLGVIRSEFRGNTTMGGGGGMLIHGDASILQSTIVQNEGPYGGGLGVSGAITITQSAILGNIGVAGGGVFLTGSLVMVNSTVASNSSTSAGGGFYESKYGPPAFVNIYNSTIAFNRADEDHNLVGSGGGIYVEVPNNSPFNIYNSIIAANVSGATAQHDDCKGVVQTHGQNLFGNTNGCTIVQISGSWDYLNSLSLLGPLQDNGGPTQTVALLAGSNAIDAGNPTIGCLDKNSMTIETDQRGFPRNVGICDLGAYEYGSVDSNDVIFSNGFE